MDNTTFKQNLVRKGFELAKKTILLSDILPKKSSIQVINYQLLRSATSIGANIVEAQSASSKKDFANFLGYALKSANETKFWLALLKETFLGETEAIQNLVNLTNELAKILGSIIATLKGKRKF
ncbi:four helix bundle protein [Candidatus Peregrinibacteria bacterium CG08_land_8_20_14_0_20_41_10]|nr:MAG: hypothetical protein AUJ78_00330 [Candidatus Peregrinibacteria bacterium CG1_02_41_10]PIS32179.1 MAG: four helix bundle protein [Candidatus Peregrinibacteria bacterium CG08_land_8_20_14_0_20_41_10]